MQPGSSTQAFNTQCLMRQRCRTQRAPTTMLPVHHQYITSTSPVHHQYITTASPPHLTPCFLYYNAGQGHLRSTIQIMSSTSFHSMFNAQTCRPPTQQAAWDECLSYNTSLFKTSNLSFVVRISVFNDPLEYRHN